MAIKGRPLPPLISAKVLHPFGILNWLEEVAIFFNVQIRIALRVGVQEDFLEKINSGHDFSR